MKRLLIYGLILGAVCLAPAKPLEIGKLLPVQVVAVYREDGQTVIRTDTGNVGKGANAAEALINIAQTADGILYLDTAQYLMMTEDAQNAVEQMRGELRRSVQLCRMDTTISPEEAGDFLSSHGELPRLKDWKPGGKLPVLGRQRESLIFI